MHGILPVDIAVCAAAVADWKVANKSDQKIKKQKNINYETLSLSQNPDILKTLSNADNNRPDLVIGFAAETEDILHNGIRKQKKKIATGSWQMMLRWGLKPLEEIITLFTLFQKKKPRSGPL